MQRILRLMSLACALSLALGNAAFALNPQPLPPAIIKLSDGRQLLMNKQHVLFILSANRKAGRPAAPGTYTLPNGHVVRVGKGGVLDQKSWVEFNPQPDPPGVTRSSSGY
jgi:hypothetical protein